MRKLPIDQNYTNTRQLPFPIFLRAEDSDKPLPCTAADDRYHFPSQTPSVKPPEHPESNYTYHPSPKLASLPVHHPVRTTNKPKEYT